MKALIFGPGRIGCGFAGQLLQAAGYDLVFVSRNLAMTHYLNRMGRYKVDLVSRTERREVIVGGVRSVCITDPEQVIKEINEANLIITAVGASNLTDVANLIAAGIQYRDMPVNIIAFENLVNAGPHLRKLVAKHLPSDFPLTQYGFSGALVSRMVTHRLGDPVGKDLLTFIADSSDTFVVDRLNLCQPFPVVKGMIMTDEYAAWIHRKLFIFSAGHASCAYLGYLKGYHYIHTSIRDPEIRAAVLAAMVEGQHALAVCYGQDVAGNEDDLLGILDRFENAVLSDPVIRVGRDPTRKLRIQDRLVGAAQLAEKAGIQPKNLALAVAAGLYFYNETDPSSAELRHEIEAMGLASTLKRICGLDPRQDLGRSVTRFYRKFKKGWQENNPLLGLDEVLWAWK